MVEISTSLLNANKDKIVDTIQDLEKAKTDYFHIDVMDGEFVKNNTHDLMLKYGEYLNQITREPLDIHLMVKDIKNYVDSYAIFSPNIITFHYEACKDDEEASQVIEYIKAKTRRVGIAIKPETPVSKIFKLLPYVHIVLVMTVEPGEGGQKLIPEAIGKIKELYNYREENNLNYDIEVDGGVNKENSQQIIENGADILVAGTAILSAKDYKTAIRELR